MLRLIRQNKQAAICLRDKDPIISPPFKVGLVIAFSIHLLLFSCFRVKPFKEGGDYPVIKPITVEVDVTEHTICVAQTLPFTIPPSKPDFPDPIFGLPSNAIEYKQYSISRPLSDLMEQPMEYQPLEIDFEDDRD